MHNSTARHFLCGLLAASAVLWVACGATQPPRGPEIASEQKTRVADARQAAEESLERELIPDASAPPAAPPGGGTSRTDTDIDGAGVVLLAGEVQAPPHVSTANPKPEPALVRVEPPSPPPEPFAEAKWVQASGAAYLQTRSAEEAHHLALRKALENAVRIAAGERIDVTQLRIVTEIVTENDSQLLDAFMEVSEVNVQGYVTDYRDLRWETVAVENPDPSGPPIPGFVAHLTAFVRPPEGERDAAFWLRVEADNVTLRHGDEAAFTIEASQDAYLTMLNIQSRGEVAVAVPYAGYVEELFISAGETMVFPSDALRESGYRLRATVPLGMDAVAESFVIVATRGKVPPPQPEDGGLLDIMDLNRWLANIPQDGRAEDVIVFDIHRK